MIYDKIKLIAHGSYRINKYSNILIEKLFLIFIKNRIKNYYLTKIFYKIFSLYQYIDIKTNKEIKFKDERNHYIPKFILNNFAIKTNSGEIYQYGKNKEFPSKGVSIRREAANIKNYYATNKLDDGRPSNFIEKSLFANLAEKFGALVIKNLLENPDQSITPLEENILATHSAFQYVRTPAFAEQLKIYILYLLEIKKVPREVFSNKGKNELRKIFEHNSLNIDDNDVRNYFIDLMRKNIDVNKVITQKLDNSHAIVKVIFMFIGVSIIQPLFNKKISIIEAKAPFFFIMPDSGAVIIDTKEPGCNWPFGWNFKRKTKILLLPLSPEKCLVFHQGKIDNTLSTLFRDCAIGSSYYQHFRYIYSDRKDITIQDNLNNL